MQMLMLDFFKNSYKKEEEVVFKQPKHNYLWKIIIIRKKQ
jgi:hypothetical protein